MKSLKLVRTKEKTLLSREEGKSVRMAILRELKRDNVVTIDFQNLKIASPSFFDEALGVLARDYDLDFIQNHITLQKIDDYDRALVNALLIKHAKEREKNASPKKTIVKKKGRLALCAKPLIQR